MSRFSAYNNKNNLYNNTGCFKMNIGVLALYNNYNKVINDTSKERVYRTVLFIGACAHNVSVRKC